MLELQQRKEGQRAEDEDEDEEHTHVEANIIVVETPRLFNRIPHKLISAYKKRTHAQNSDKRGGN